jgi:hypothetical protein
MKKLGTSSKTSTKRTSAAVIGHKAFARISAIEGITLTAAMKRRADEFDRKGLSPAECRRAAYSEDLRVRLVRALRTGMSARAASRIVRRGAYSAM